MKTPPEQGEIIKATRLAKGHTQIHVSKSIGMDRASYCQMENGKRNVKALELAALCDLWGIPYSVLFVATKPQ